jgi:hypothetical protein
MPYKPQDEARISWNRERARRGLPSPQGRLRISLRLPGTPFPPESTDGERGGSVGRRKVRENQRRFGDGQEGEVNPPILSLEQLQDYRTLTEFLRGCRSLTVASTLRIAFEVYQSWNCFSPQIALGRSFSDRVDS